MALSEMECERYFTISAQPCIPCPSAVPHPLPKPVVHPDQMSASFPETRLACPCRRDSSVAMLLVTAASTPNKQQLAKVLDVYALGLQRPLAEAEAEAEAEALAACSRLLLDVPHKGERHSTACSRLFVAIASMLWWLCCSW